MELRRLGTSDAQVSVVGLGGWAFGAEPAIWGPVDDNESIATIQRAIDLGVNLIDTAPSYGRGHSEMIIGKAIAGRRDGLVIATKFGLVGKNGNAPLVRCLDPASIRSECEESLRRLRVETIDLYQIHRPDPATPIADVMQALLGLREEGKINLIGLANFGCERLGEVRRHGPVQSLQTECSLIEPEAADDLLPYCREYSVSVLACSPLARGLLTGKLQASDRFADLRAKDSRFCGEAFSRHLHRVQWLAELAGRVGCTTAQLALRWVIQQTGVTSVIAGAKRISQIKENAAAGEMSLSPEVVEEIDRRLARRD